MKYEEATKTLQPVWEAWVDAVQAERAAAQAYRHAARESGAELCTTCNKPKPDYDHSQECDGCHLPWGWATRQGLRDSRAAQLDREIERLRAERAKL